MMWALSLLCLLLLSPVAAAAHKPARIVVTVDFLSPSGERQLLAGATVTLLDAAGKVTSQDVANDQGVASLEKVPAGEYKLTVEMPGFVVFGQNVAVRAGEVLELSPRLALEQLSESVNVTADSPQEVSRQPELPAVINRDSIKNAPLASERFQDVLPTVPGVVRGPDGMLNMKGARASQSGLLVNSVNVTDPVTGQFAMELPIEAVDSVHIYANPYAAEFGKFTGGVTSVETRSGTNEFKYLITNFMPRARNRDGKICGFESFTPRVAVAGSIIKDKLFFMQSFEYRFILTEVPSLPFGRNETKMETFDSFSRLDWRINEAHRLTGALSFYPQHISYVGLDTFHPKEVTPNFRQNGFFLAFNEQALLGMSSLLDTTFSVKQFNSGVWGNSTDPMVISPMGYQGGFFNIQDRNSRRYELSQVYTFSQFKWYGTNTPKIGYIISRSDFDGWEKNGDVRIRRGDGSLSQLIQFEGPGKLKGGATEVTAFVQNRHQLGDPLTLDYGVRLDWDSISESAHLAPRFGFALLPFPGSIKTVIRGGVGMFYDKIALNVGAFSQYQHLKVTRFSSDGITPLGETIQYGHEVRNGRLENPYSLTWNLEMDRELWKGFSARVGYERRSQKRDLVLDPVDGTNPRLVLSNRGSSSYWEWVFSVRYKLPGGNDFSASYVRSSAKGNLNAYEQFFGNYHNPVIRQDEVGPMSFDAPHRVILQGVARLPFEITLMPLVEIRNGFPYSVINQDQDYIGARNRSGRFPRFFSMDMTAVKKVDLKFMGKTYHTQVGVKIYNVTNHFNPRNIQNNIDATDFGSFSNSVGRTFRGKFEIEF